MKRISALIIALMMVTGISLSAQADPIPGTQNLYDRGGGLIYDADRNITWLQEPNNASMTWYQAMDWALTLSYYDTVRKVTWSDWRLPTALNYDGTGPDAGYSDGGEMGNLYFSELNNVAGGPLVNRGPFSNLNNLYWSSTEYADPNWSTFAWFFDFGYGIQGAYNRDHHFSYALAIRDGDVISVPEPTTMLLLGFGLMGIAGVRRKFRK